MYDIKQFRPTLYILLLLGFLGYAVAAQTPGLWLLATGATLVNIWIVTKGKFRPMPRLVANVVTLIFAGWLVLRVKQMPGPPILAIGEFLIFLQLVKMYEQRGNRDLAQLLVLSLLLMVAAAISTGSLMFGLMFVLYLFLSLYCCLLFHLKTEADHAKALMELQSTQINPTTLSQDQRFLSRSMRRLTAFVSTIAVTMAVLVFLFFPRGTGAGIIGNLAFKPSNAMTGFSDQVSFQDVAKISQNEAEVAYVSIQKNYEAWGDAGQPIYLRGSALDTYVSDSSDADRWKWIRAASVETDVIPAVTRGQEYQLNNNATGGDRYQQTIRLLPTGSNILFAMPGVVSFTPSRELRLHYGRLDDVLQLQEPLTGELPYTVVSTGTIGAEPTTQPVRIPLDQYMVQEARRRGDSSRIDPAKRYAVPDEIRRFALQDSVAGMNAGGNLAAQRLKAQAITTLDEEVARSFEQYLQNEFTYTLDLTEARRVNDKDPLVQFLYDFKTGHCEYFAGAMALMCQSVGMKARVIVGFKCDDFNSIGGYYTVKQSHAHAWVEVLTLNGWQMFDPTASRTNDTTRSGGGAWRQLMNFVDYLEYAWGNNVVNYDADTRTNLIQNVDSGLTNTAIRTSSWVQDLKSWFDLQNFYWVSSGLLSVLVAGMICAVVGAMIYFLYERMRLRRRAQRIGLGQLPTADQKRLARQLAFYDDLLRVMDRSKVNRPSHMTPQEFSRSIGFLPNEVYVAIQRLTRIFYRVRYGGHELDASQQRRLLRVVERIEQNLGMTAKT